MAIDVHVQDESGNILASYAGPTLGLAFLKLAPASGACFRFVVPWADTTFNSEQVKVLRAELEEVMRANTDQNRHREVKALLEFLAAATGSHTYVKFVGD